MRNRLIIFFIMIFALTGCSADSSSIRFGAAGIGGAYHVFSDIFAGVVSEADNGYDMQVKTTAGSAANLRLLSKGYLQMAIAQNDMTNDAYYGEGNFAGGDKYRGYSAIATLYDEACQIVVRKDSNIKSVNDLQGKNISIGEKESGTEQSAKQILQAYGLTDRLVKTVQLDYTSAADKLKDMEIDAFFCTAGTATTVISELAKQCDIELLSLDDESIKKLESAYKSYNIYTIPAGTYNGQKQDVKTVAVKALLLASDKLSDKTVKDITKILFDKKEEIQLALPVDISLDEKTAVEGISIPFHKGAAEYYKECGIDVKIEKGNN